MLALSNIRTLQPVPSCLHNTPAFTAPELIELKPTNTKQKQCLMKTQNKTTSQSIGVLAQLKPSYPLSIEPLNWFNT